MTNYYIKFEAPENIEDFEIEDIVDAAQSALDTAVRDNEEYEDEVFYAERFYPSDLTNETQEDLDSTGQKHPTMGVRDWQRYTKSRNEDRYTFDDARKELTKLYAKGDFENGNVGMYTIETLLIKLQNNYAPVIEATPEQLWEIHNLLRVPIRDRDFGDLTQAFKSLDQEQIFAIRYHPEIAQIKKG